MSFSSYLFNSYSSLVDFADYTVHYSMCEVLTDVLSADGLIELRDGLKRSRRLKDKTTVMWNHLAAIAAMDEVGEHKPGILE